MQRILVLTAIPDGLRLDKEIRLIEEAIRRAVKRDLFEIKIRTAVRFQDIRRAMSDDKPLRVYAEEQPSIVHFCGHGQEDGSLILEDDYENHKPVSPIGLAALFKLHIDYVKCVLLNACYSSKPAEAIAKLDLKLADSNILADLKAFLQWLCVDVADSLELDPQLDKHWQDIYTT